MTFEGREAIFRHEQGALYVAWLLLHPPQKPIHALALALEARTCSGQTSGAADVIQQRYLGLDEAEAVRNMRRRERELEVVLDEDEEVEPVKAEALRELEAIADFMRQHPWRSRDCVLKCAREVGLAIRCLHARLAVAVDVEGRPDAVLRRLPGTWTSTCLFPRTGAASRAGSGWGLLCPVGSHTSRRRESCGNADCGLRSAECGVRDADFRMRISDFGMRIAESKAPPAESKVHCPESSRAQLGGLRRRWGTWRGFCVLDWGWRCWRRGARGLGP